MSIRAPAAATTTRTTSRLSQVLSAGLERQMSLGICPPCVAATDLIVENDEGKDWSKVTGPLYPNGPRFTKGCPDDDDDDDNYGTYDNSRPNCEERDKVNIDPITLDEFGVGKPLMLLGCGHCYDPRTLERWVRQNKKRKCIYDDGYDMTDKELQELGFMPIEMGEILYANETRVDEEDGGAQIYRDSENGPVLVRVLRPNGRVIFLEGPRNQERMVKIMFPDGAQIYEGAAGVERLVKRVYTNGNKNYYEGESGEERLVKVELPNGSVQFFDGPRGQERLTAARVPAGGGYYTFEGSRGQERMVSRVLRGYKFIYSGEKGKERVVLTEPVEGWEEDGSYEDEFD